MTDVKWSLWLVTWGYFLGSLVFFLNSLCDFTTVVGVCDNLKLSNLIGCTLFALAGTISVG
jgi:hypothetical protein